MPDLFFKIFEVAASEVAHGLRGHFEDLNWSQMKIKVLVIHLYPKNCTQVASEAMGGLRGRDLKNFEK